MPWKGDSTHDEPNESECRVHSVGVSHLEEGRGGEVSLGSLDNWLAVDGEYVDRLKSKMLFQQIELSPCSHTSSIRHSGTLRESSMPNTDISLLNHLPSWDTTLKCPKKEVERLTHGMTGSPLLAHFGINDKADMGKRQ